MKIKSAFVAISAAALLAACGQSATPAAGSNPAATAQVDLKAPSGVYNLDPTHASVQWTLLHNSISNYGARFNNYSGKLVLDASDLSKSSIEITIDPASIDANYPGDYKGTHAGSGFNSWSEDIAKNANFLNAGAFPQITFKSTSVDVTSPTTADVTGDLTFLGVTKPVTMKATFNGEIEKHPFMNVPAIGFGAVGTFKRTDFSMALGPVGDEVTVRFEGEFVKEAEPAAPAA